MSFEKLEDIVVGWYAKSSGNSSLYISAPNLKILIWSGKLMNHLTLGKFRCLEDAMLRLRPDANDSDKVCEISHSLCKVQVLFLNEPTIKVPFRKGSMQAPLNDVLCLNIRIGRLTDELIPAIVSLLKGMPNLYRLSIKSEPPLDDPQSNTSGFDVGYWKMQILAFIDQLKVFRIELYYDSNGIDLAWFILECAKNLLEMTVTCPPQDSKAVTTKLKETKIVSGAKLSILKIRKDGLKLL